MIDIFPLKLVKLIANLSFLSVCDINCLDSHSFSRCVDFLELNTDMTPYFLKRRQHLLQKVQRMLILDEDKYSTHRTIIDTKYTNPSIRWEVDTRVFHCCCGKYEDRCFPCAHVLKALQDMDQPIDNYIHQSYYTATIRNALKNVNKPVPLTFLEEDPIIRAPPSHSRNSKVSRYLFGFEKSQNK